MAYDVELVLDAKNIVGESPIWSSKENALYWVDIVGSTINRFEPGTKRHDTWQTPELPTSIGLRAGGGVIVGLRTRIAMWEQGGRFDTFAVIEPDGSGNRLNEGSVGPDGAYWVGSMQDNIGPSGEPMAIDRRSGRLYRVDPSGTVQAVTEPMFWITNTLVWTDDGRLLTADTLDNVLYSFSAKMGVLRRLLFW